MKLTKLFFIALIALSHSFALAQASKSYKVRPHGTEYIAFDSFEQAEGFIFSIEDLFSELECRDTSFYKTVIVSEQFVGVDPACPNCLLAFEDIYSICPSPYNIELSSKAYHSKLFPIPGGALGFAPLPTNDPEEVKASKLSEIVISVNGERVPLNTESKN